MLTISKTRPTSKNIRIGLTLVCIILIRIVQCNTSSAILPPHLVLKGESSMIMDPATLKSYSERTKRRHQRIKPSGDLDLPILPFHYSTSRDKMPLDSDLDPRTLSMSLGSNFDPEFMSASRPLESIRHPNGTYFYDPKIFGRTKYKKSLEGPSAKTRSDLTLLHRDETNSQITPFTLPGLPGIRFHIQNKKRRLQFEKFLTALTYCPVRFKWKDLGPRFWPRWIKEGHCKDVETGSSRRKIGPKKKDSLVRRSCSMPAGMTCVPNKSTTMTLLWWHCRQTLKTSQKNSTPQCVWINIKYPIITKCTCSCK